MLTTPDLLRFDARGSIAADFRFAEDEDDIVYESRCKNVKRIFSPYTECLKMQNPQPTARTELSNYRSRLLYFSMDRGRLKNVMPQERHVSHGSPDTPFRPPTPPTPRYYNINSKPALPAGRPEPSPSVRAQEDQRERGECCGDSLNRDVT